MNPTHSPSAGANIRKNFQMSALRTKQEQGKAIERRAPRKRTARPDGKPARAACAALAALTVLALSAACAAPAAGNATPERADSAPAAETGSTAAPSPDAQAANVRLYTPENSWEPDTVSADTMGEVLCDTTLPDGTWVVCYREPGSEYTKYWALRDGDTLLRFCAEESAYGAGYAAEPFSNVRGQDGFRILAPRGAGYFAYDYYVPDEAGVPRLLAACANSVETADFNGDGETDLRWDYHGGAQTYTYFYYDGRLYLAQSDVPDTPLPVLLPGEDAEDGGFAQLRPISAANVYGGTLPEGEFDAQRAEFLSAELDADALRRGARETANLRLLQTLPEQGIALYGYESAQCFGYGIVLFVSGTQQLYRFPIPYMGNHAIPPELYPGADGLLYLTAHTGTGTGIAYSELYVFRPDADMAMEHVPYGDVTGALSEAVRVWYNSETGRAAVYDRDGTLLLESAVSAMGALPDEPFAPDSYFCGAVLGYEVQEGGGFTAQFDVRLCGDAAMGEGGAGRGFPAGDGGAIAIRRAGRRLRLCGDKSADGNIDLTNRVYP